MLGCFQVQDDVLFIFEIKQKFYSTWPGLPLTGTSGDEGGGSLFANGISTYPFHEYILTS